MTLVAGYVDKDTRQVHMLADSYSYDSSGCYPNTVKIERRKLTTPNGTPNGDVLIGHAGEHSVAFLARNAPLPTLTRNGNPWDVVDGIAKSLQAFGAELAGGINYHGGTDQIYLVAWNGYLWSFVHYDILEVSPFGAIGAGNELAIGALEVLSKSVPPKDALRLAAQVAERRSHIVKSPFKIETVEPL